MGSVKLQERDTMVSVLSSLKKQDYGRCGSNYDEETNNNNQMVAESDSESTQDGSSGTWDKPWSSQLAPPGSPSIIAKDANSLTFQWDDANGQGMMGYEVEMQQLDVVSGTVSPDPMLAEEAAWSMVYSGKERWTQIKSLYPGRYYAVRVRTCHAELMSAFSDVVVLHTTPTVPSEPRPPELIGLEHDSMELEWDAPWEDGGAEVTGYRLQLRPPPGPCPESQVKDLIDETGAQD